MLVQGSEEWLELRKSHIGASDAPVIMGVSPWKSIYQLWQEKVGFSIPRGCSPAMQRGLNLEPLARETFTEMTGIYVEPSVIFSFKNPWMMASLDGIDSTGKYIVEIKCAGESDHAAAIRKEIPSKYYPQLQHQLAVCELESMYYFSFDGFSGTCLVVHRNDKYIDDMIRREEKFWEHVRNFTPPLSNN